MKTELMKKIVICALAGCGLAACTGQGEFTELETQAASLSETMEAIERCGETMSTPDGQPSEHYRDCLEDHGVEGADSPRDVCNDLRERCDRAIADYGVNCENPADDLEDIVCDVADYADDCGAGDPGQPGREGGGADGDSPDGPEGNRDGGADGSEDGGDFCDDVRETASENEESTLTHQFPECFGGGDTPGENECAEGDACVPDGEREGEGGTDPCRSIENPEDLEECRDGSGGEGGGWNGGGDCEGENCPGGDSGWSGTEAEMCQRLMEEMRECQSEADCADVRELFEEHCL